MSNRVYRMEYSMHQKEKETDLQRTNFSNEQPSTINTIKILYLYNFNNFLIIIVYLYNVDSFHSLYAFLSRLH